jgi:hypothetical protein
MNWNHVSKSGIALYTEGLWLYFGLALIAKLEWDITATNPLWWILAAIGGFVTCVLLGNHRRNPLWSFTANSIVLIGILIYHLKHIPDGYGSYAIAASISISVLYIRSCVLFFVKLTRLQMLLRFEGNLVFYLLFVIIQQFNPFTTPIIHLCFIFAIMFSLVGMVLTLQSKENTSETMETRVVGETRWLSVVIIGCFMFSFIVAALLLLPFVRSGLMATITAIWHAVVGLGAIMDTAVRWFFSLFPTSEGNLVIRNPAAEQLSQRQGLEQAKVGLPLFWIKLALGIAGLIGLWFVGQWLKRYKPAPLPNIQKTGIRSHFTWQGIWNWLASIIEGRWAQIRKRFPGYFALPIYSQYDWLIRWAKKNGMDRMPGETPKQFANRLGEMIERHEKEFMYTEKTYHIKAYVEQLGHAYSAAYYSDGRHIANDEFQPLIRYLKMLRIKLRSTDDD